MQTRIIEMAGKSAGSAILGNQKIKPHKSVVNRALNAPNEHPNSSVTIFES